MGNEWINKTIEDIAKHQKGFAFKSKDYQEVGCPVVRVSNFTEDSIDCSSLYFVSEKIQKETEAVALIKNDVVIATVGSWPKNPASIVGKTIRVPLEAEGSLLNQNAVRLRASGCENFDQIFLYYLLKDKKFSDYIVSTAQGSANQASITLKDIYGYSFDYPSDTERRKISEILDSLDNKIQLNRETNQTLEAMAQALFKSWFVDFDPVFDNIIAHNLAHNNAPLHNIPEPLLPHAQRRLNVHNVGRGSARQTAAHAFHHLFPQAFEQSDEPSVGIQGWIPKGWGAGLTSEIATTNEISWTKKSAPLSVDYVDLANAKNGRIQETTSYSYDEAPSRAKRCLSIGDTIIGLVRPGNRSFAYISVSGLTGSTGFAVMRPKDINLQAYLYFHLTRDDVIDEFARLADGAAYPAIRPEVVSNLECIVPPAELLHEFQQVAGHLLEKIGFNVEEVKVLESLRDTLLPKLISGELRIPDAEQATEALAK